MTTAPTIVSGSLTPINTGATQATSVSATLPSGAQTGDLWVIVGGCQSVTSAGQDITANHGTRVGPSYMGSSGLRPTYVWLVPIPAIGSAPASVTLTTTGATGRWVGESFLVRGADLTNPLDASSAALATTTPTTGSSLTGVAPSQATSVTVETLGLAVYHGVNTAGQGNPTWPSTPTGYTQQASINSVTSGAGSNDSLLLLSTTAATVGTAVGPALSGINAQSALSALALTIKAGAPPAPPSTPGLTVWNGTAEVPALATIWNGTAEVAASLMLYRGPTTYSSLISGATTTKPFYVAHRCGSANWPEFVQIGAVRSANLNFGALEISVWRTPDGVFVCQHDQTTTRTIPATSYDVTATNWTGTLQGLNVSPVGTDNQAQPVQPLCRLETLLDMYASDHVIYLEDKSGVNSAALLNLVKTYPNYASHFVWKQYGPANTSPGIAAAKALGITNWAYYFADDMPNFESTYATYDTLGIDFACTDSDIQEVVAKGKLTLGHIIANGTDEARMLSLGCTGIVTSVPKTLHPGLLGNW